MPASPITRCWNQVDGSPLRRAPPRSERKGKQADQPFADRSKRAPVNGRRSEPIESSKVFGGGIAAVGVETVLGKEEVVAIHPPVPGDLCQYRGGRDCAATAVALDQRGLGNLDSWNPESIDDEVIRPDREPFNRPSHRAKRRAAYVPPIDPGRRDRPDPPPFACGEDHGNKTLPLRRREEFRVGEARDRDSRSQDDRGRYDRPRDATAADLIGAGHVRRAPSTLGRLPPAAGGGESARGSRRWPSPGR